jgi:hypothetical protein
MGETRLRFAATFTCITLAFSSGFAQSETVVVVAAAPVRIMPDASRVPLAMLRPGTTLRVEEHEGDWYRVSFRDVRWGWRVGYVQAEHVGVAPGPAKAPEVLQKAEIARPVVEPDVPAAERADATAAAVPIAPPPSASVPTDAASSEHLASASHDTEISRRAISESIAIGRRQHGRTQGLQLADSARQFPAAFGGVDGTGISPTTGLRLQVFTPLAWIRQLAGEARVENRKFSLDQLSDEAIEPVLRVIAYVSVRSTAGLTGSGGVQDVVLRHPTTGVVVQPTFKAPFQSRAANGAPTAFEGLLVKFPMDAVRELRAAAEDREFVITIVGSTRETRDFHVTKKDFDRLPGAR